MTTGYLQLLHTHYPMENSGALAKVGYGGLLMKIAVMGPGAVGVLLRRHAGRRRAGCQMIGAGQSRNERLWNGYLWLEADTRRFKKQHDARLNTLHHTGERHAMECAAICFNVCIAAVLLIFAPAKSPQRDVQL
jgi:hypothetical protein